MGLQNQISTGQSSRVKEAHLVARGFTYQTWIDYDRTPVAQMAIVRLLTCHRHFLGLATVPDECEECLPPQCTLLARLHSVSSRCHDSFMPRLSSSSLRSKQKTIEPNLSAFTLLYYRQGLSRVLMTTLCLFAPQPAEKYFYTMLMI